MADKDFRVKLGIEVGANASIAGAITTVDSIQFDLAAGVDIPALGQFAWNADDNTVSLGLGVASLQLGQEEFIFIKNQSGETIGNGNTVMFAGTVKVGLTVSITLIVCVKEVALPQASVAVQVLVIVFVLPQAATSASL